MNYANLIEKAWKIVWANKYLWWLGALAASLESAFQLPNLNFSDITNFFKDNNVSAPAASALNFTALTKFLASIKLSAAKLTANLSTSTAESLAIQFLPFIVAVVGVILAIFVALIIIALIAKAGLITAILEIERTGLSPERQNNHPGAFKKNFKAGASVFGRVLGIELLIGIFIVLALIILSAPVIILVLYRKILEALIFGLLLLPLLIIFGFYLSIIEVFSLRLTVDQKTKIWDSLEQAQLLLQREKRKVILSWLISIGLGVALTTVIGLLVTLIALPLTGLGVGLYSALGAANFSLLVIVLYGLLAATVVIGMLAIAMGAAAAFISTFLTLCYLELGKQPNQPEVDFNAEIPRSP